MLLQSGTESCLWIPRREQREPEREMLGAADGLLGDQMAAYRAGEKSVG